MLFISCLLQTILPWTQVSFDHLQSQYSYVPDHFRLFLVAVTPFGAYSPLSGEPNLRVLEMESPGLFGRPSFLDLYCEF